MTVSYFEPPSNFPGNSRSRLKPGTLWFRYLAEINLILGAWYLHWRFTQSLNFAALWLAIPLLIAEVYSYLGGVIFTIGLWRPLERQVRSLDQMRPHFTEAEYPTVDVFITCYNEPVEIIESTTRAALDLDYPIGRLQIYVLDDGNSSTVREMTHRLCMSDRYSERLRQHEVKLQTELTQLMQRFCQLEGFVPEIGEIQFLMAELKSTPSEEISTSHSLLLRNLCQMILLFNSDFQDLSEQLQREKQKLMSAIAQKEKELLQLTRCHYIARPKPIDRPHHAKAGNINYALFSGKCSGQFLVTLDTDHVLQPQFLKRVLPYFYTYNLYTVRYESNQVALVQTPQDFRNLPVGDPFGHSAHLFYGPIQQGKDGLNSAFYTGTNAVLRREALISVGLQQFSKEYAQDQQRLQEFDLVGAMSTHSITEDMNTAMRLHAAGWQTIYHNELMASGLAPNDLSSTLKQRLRWAQGTIQVLMHENPLTLPGLSIWQRLQYFQTMYSYFSGFATLLYLIYPILYFFTAISPIHAAGMSFALHFLPVFMINRLTFMAATRGIPWREVWRSEQYAIALFPLYIQSVLTVLTGRSLSFQVTPKHRQSGVFLKLIIPQLTIFGLTLLGLLWNGYLFLNGSLIDPWVSLINGLWGVYNLTLLWVIIRAAVWQPKSPVYQRTSSKKPERVPAKPTV